MYRPSDDIESEINYHASDSIWFNVQRSTVFLYGDAHVDYGDISLDASRMEINYATNLVCAFAGQDTLGNYFGVPDFKDGDQEVQALELCYNYKTERARIAKIYLEQDEWKIQGDTVLVDEEKNLYIKDGKFCPCEDVDNGTYIKSNKIKIIPGKKVITGPFNLYIADVPTPLGFLFGFFPIAKEKASGVIIPTFGEIDERGFYLKDGGYYWAVNDYIGLATTGEVYSKGGAGLGVEMDYKKRYRYSGFSSFKYRNVVRFADEKANREITHDYRFRWKHTPVSRGGKRFTSDVDFSSVTNNFNNSSSTQEAISNTVKSNISYSSPIKKTPFNYALMFRHNQSNQTGEYNFSLPDANLSMSRLYFFKPLVKGRKTALKEFVKSIGSSYSFKFENKLSNKYNAPSYSYPVYTEESGVFVPKDSVFELSPEELQRMWEQKRLGMRHSIPISATYKIGQALNLNGNLTYTENWYTQSNTYKLRDSARTGSEDAIVVDTVAGFSRVGTYSTNFNFSSRMYGFYGFKKSKTVFRHLMVPSVGFRYSPDYSENGLEDLKYENGDEVKDSNGEVVQLNRYQDALYRPSTSREQKSITLSLTNSVEMKITKNDSVSKKIKIFDNLGVSTSYNFAEGERYRLAPIVFNSNTNVLNVVTVQSGMTVDPYVYYFNDETERYEKGSRFFWEDGKGLGRIERANLSFSSSLNPDKFKKKKGNEPEVNIEEEFSATESSKDSLENAEMEIEEYESSNSNYVNFKVPWNLRLRYNMRYSENPNTEKSVSNNIDMSGDFKLTPKWRIGYSVSYNVEQKKFVTPKLNFYRDLNCWEMRIDWIPFGPRQQYAIYINIKSSTLKDLKISKKNNFYDR